MSALPFQKFEDRHFGKHPVLFADYVSQPELLTVYIPNTDSTGRLVNTSYWIAATAQFLAHKFGGSTVHAADRGYFRNPHTDELIEEVTHRISVLVEPDDLCAHATAIEMHVRRFGRETNQCEVLLQLGGQVLRYTNFQSTVSH